MGCSTAGSARTEDEGEEHEAVFMSPMPPGGRVNTHVRFDDEGKPAWHEGCWVATLKFGGEAAARPTSMTLWHKCAEPAAAEAEQWSDEEWAAWDAAQWEAWEQGTWEEEAAEAEAEAAEAEAADTQTRAKEPANTHLRFTSTPQAEAAAA